MIEYCDTAAAPSLPRSISIQAGVPSLLCHCEAPLRSLSNSDAGLFWLPRDDENVMLALDEFCATTPVNVFGTDLTFLTLPQALAAASQAEGRTPSAPRDDHGPSDFVQLAGVPPQADANLDDLCDQLAEVYRSPIPTVQMCTKLDSSTGQRVQAQQNGRVRFHVACNPDDFKQVCAQQRSRKETKFRNRTNIQYSRCKENSACSRKKLRARPCIHESCTSARVHANTRAARVS